MSELPIPIAILAADVPTRGKVSSYPEPFALRMAGREKRILGDLFGLRNFGVNLTRLLPEVPHHCATRIRCRTSSSISCKAIQRCIPTRAGHTFPGDVCGLSSIDRERPQPRQRD
jgi:hypothetical protein